MPRLQELVEKDDYVGAFDLARESNRWFQTTHSCGRSNRNSRRVSASPRTHRGDGPLSSVRGQGNGLARDRRDAIDNQSMPRGSDSGDSSIPDGASTMCAIRNPGMQLGNSPEPTIRARFANMDLTVHLADEPTIPTGWSWWSRDLPVTLVSDQAPSICLPIFSTDTR